MMSFNLLFSDVPSGGYDFYVVLHFAYGQTYVDATWDDWLLFSRGASCEAILGGVVELTEEDNIGMPQCHRVAYSGQHQCQAGFYVLSTYIYNYLLFS